MKLFLVDLSDFAFFAKLYNSIPDCVIRREYLEESARGKVRPSQSAKENAFYVEQCHK